MKDMELQKRIENAVDTTLASLNPSARECDLLIENKALWGKKYLRCWCLPSCLCC